MSRVISGSQGEDCRPWDIPDLADHAAGTPVAGIRHSNADTPGRLTAGDLETIEQQAREEGFEAGYREGIEAGRQAQASRIEYLEQLMQALTRPLADLDRQVEADLVELAIAIARQLLHGEYEIAPERVARVVRDAIGMLPAASRVVRLQLHPEDAALVRELVQLPESAGDWQIIEDPTVSRGGCLVDSETVRVDATVEGRLEAILATMMTDETAEGGEG